MKFNLSKLRKKLWEMLETDADPDVLVVRGTCAVTGDPVEFEVPKAAVEEWQAGAYIQHAFKDLEAWKREYLISSIGQKGWEQTFPPEAD